MSLHDTIRKIYDRIIKLSFLEVMSDDGWQEVESLNIGKADCIYVVRTKSYVLKCTSDHILFDADGNEIFAKDCLGKKVLTKDGPQEVEKLDIVDEKFETYDLSLKDGSSHKYFTNGMLSHNCVIMDEAAFVPNNIASKVFESIYPVISSSKNSQFIMVSTPRGADTKNLYYDIWCKANSKAADKNTEGWKPFRFDWWDVPGRDEQWKKNTIASIGQQRFDQEFGNVFMTSSSMRKLIPDDIIEKYRIKLSEYKTKGIESKKQKILSDKEDELYEFDMWHEFQPNRTYVASGDISEGVGGDSSVLYVWDVTDLSNIIMCAKFASNTISLVQFAYVCSKILALYNNPFLFAERNGVSAGMLDSLKITYGYQNIASENKKNEPGIYSHVQVKGKACLWTRDMMTTKGFGFTIYDKDLLDEIGIFVKKDTKGLHNVYHAAPGPNSHDDHMLAFVWACYCLQNEIIEKYFVVCETFTDDLGQIKPKILAPLTAYRVEDISKVRNDPIYKQFLEFKNELNLKLKQAMELEQKDIQSDIFKYKRYDAYFGEYVDEDTWNNMPLNWNMRQQNIGNQTNLNPGAIRPSFFIL